MLLAQHSKENHISQDIQSYLPIVPSLQASSLLPRGRFSIEVLLVYSKAAQGKLVSMSPTP